MADLDARPLLMTETASVWDVACPGACKHRSDEEYVAATHLVFPYRGVYVHHVGRAETVAEANQVVILNEDEPYRVSHPFEGGDACFSIATSTAILLELAPEHYLLTKDRAAFNRSRLRVDTHTQALAACFPLLVMDMYEHSYQMDFGAAVPRYLDAFFATCDGTK